VTRTGTRVETIPKIFSVVLYVVIVDQVVKYHPPTALFNSSINIPNRDIGSALLAIPWLGSDKLFSKKLMRLSILPS
jgi:hypothetical protein